MWNSLEKKDERNKRNIYCPLPESSLESQMNTLKDHTKSFYFFFFTSRTPGVKHSSSTRESATSWSLNCWPTSGVFHYFERASIFQPNVILYLPCLISPDVCFSPLAFHQISYVCYHSGILFSLFPRQFLQILNRKDIFIDLCCHIEIVHCLYQIFLHFFY